MKNGQSEEIATRAGGRSEFFVYSTCAFDLSSDEQALILCILVLYSSLGSFMQKNCRESCYKKTYREPVHRLLSDDDQEFFDLSARDANGRVISMENLEGYVTVIVNAARVCRELAKVSTRLCCVSSFCHPTLIYFLFHSRACIEYTESFYEVLEHLHSINPWALEILAFPFNHPDIDLSTCREDIEMFEKKAGHKIHIMATIDINGPNTHPIYRYLKKLFDMNEMDPNFSHYFFVNPDGNYIELHYGVSYTSLKTFVDHHVKVELGNSGEEF